MDNIKITLLSEEDIWGDKQLEVLKKYGIISDITDLVILTGGFCVNIVHPKDNSLKGRTGWFYTKSFDGDGDVRGVSTVGSVYWYDSYERTGAVRPALLSSSVFSQVSQKKSEWI